MGRQFRPPRRGGGWQSGLDTAFTSPQVVSASSTKIAIPNYGATNLSTWAAGDYVLDAPEEGVRKLLFSVSSSSVARVIRCATDASVKIGTGGATQITAGASTLAWAVELLGVNSTQWAILNVSPYTTVAASPSIGTS